MEVWVPNNKNRLKKVLLGSVPTPSTLQKSLKKTIPKSIEKVLEETQEDLDEIKKTYESLGVEVLSYPVEDYRNDINVRDGFIVVDDHMFITEKSVSLAPLYDAVGNKTFSEHHGRYCPDIYIHDDYAILDRLPKKAYRYWRGKLSQERKIITAFNKGHSDGIYCNVADRIWLTNGNALEYKKHWPDIPVMELSTTNSGLVNYWKPAEDYIMKKRELNKTDGRYLVHEHDLSPADLEFVDNYLEKWVGYCEETLFDINMSIIDKNNVMAISQNSLVYDKLESLGVKIHKVPFRHRFFWDGGLHCITNDLVRKKD
jgi:hypothetical protein|tara:strand:+ start:227 stop:1168 length:942 start_codon:yes stop_codon:yes gene_type:complete